MKQLTSIIVVWLMLFTGVNTWWKHYASPISITERITELDLPPGANPVKFYDNYSFLFSSGITCGEIAISPETMDDLLEQVRQKGYQPNLNSRLATFCDVFRQSVCCQDSSIRLDKTPGWYKIIRKDRFETNYVVIDALRQKVHFFRSIHDMTH